MSQQQGLVLPVSVVSPTDIARLIREMESVDDFFRQAEIRSGGTPALNMPQMSKLLDAVMAHNELNPLQENHRSEVIDLLQKTQENAPVMHISFSVDPPGSHVQKIVQWLRANIDPFVLVTVGLQPNIGAGCVVRTTNKLFDMSLREYFSTKRDFFVEKMHQAISEEQPGPVLSTSPAEGVQA